MATRMTLFLGAVFSLCLAVFAAPDADAQLVCDANGTDADDHGVGKIPWTLAHEGGDACYASFANSSAYDFLPFPTGLTPGLSVFLPDQDDLPADGGHGVRIMAEDTGPVFVNADVGCPGGSVSNSGTTLVEVTLAQGGSCPLVVQATLNGNLVEYSATLSRPDAEDYALSAGTASGGNFGGSPTPLDTTAPSLTGSISSNNANTAQAKSGDVITVTISSDEPLAAAPTVTIAGEAATVTGSGDSFSASITVSGGTTQGAAALSISNYADAAGNPGTTVTSATGSVNVDTVAPSGYTITYDQDPVIIANQSSASASFSGAEVGAEFAITISFPGFDGAVPTTGTVTQASGQITGIDLSPLPDGPITVSLALTDAAGNVGATITDTATKDATAPTVVSRTRQTPATSPTNADSVTWRHTFIEAVQNVDVTDFEVTSTTSTTATVQSVTNTTGNSWDVVVSGGDLAGFNGSIAIGFDSGQNITDLAGNAFDSNVGPSGTDEYDWTIDNTAPEAVQFNRQTPSTSPTGADSVTWAIAFDDVATDIAGVDATDFAIEGFTGDDCDHHRCQHNRGLMDGDGLRR